MWLENYVIDSLVSYMAISEYTSYRDLHLPITTQEDIGFLVAGRSPAQYPRLRLPPLLLFLPSQFLLRPC